ncbi:hypothetical protein F379_048 [Campylobacter phage F379]|uniref:Membrane protein n=2 Tax=Firehammervirus TaxID=1636617 RepID=I7KLV2_9CAUD|nr:hypothetical protein [Campylobacter jejuni]YP_007005281.1 hypothetical protein F421_gp211 [Campylobacter phage CP21]QOI69334.1 hypothetical protein F379_048 [Campylobacter phage F379]QXO06246.1 hypothetical protein [Campylobacter phage CJLB-12]QXO06480.1 hypothetical protein [Campylobacter phage CJLB-14]RTH89305.1 hypothetical protein C3I33_09285 [Campylobacter jejuni]RTH91809.1 hypothetical protein C3I35_08920 [Campylobacter jejuni]
MEIIKSATSGFIKYTITLFLLGFFSGIAFTFFMTKWYFEDRGSTIGYEIQRANMIKNCIKEVDVSLEIMKEENSVIDATQPLN